MAFTLTDPVSSSMGFGTNSMSVTFSAAPANGKLITLIYVQQNASVATRTWPTGFTEALNVQVGGVTSISVATKQAASEGSATYTLSLGDANDNGQCLLGVLIDGFNTTTPVDVAGTGVRQSFFWDSSTTLVIPSITTTVANALDICIIGGNNPVPNNVTGPASYTKIDFTTGGQIRTQLWYKTLGAAGATGTRTFTGDASGGADTEGVSLAIAPAAAAGGSIVPILQSYNRRRLTA